MEIKLYKNFSKRINSTKIPDASTGITKNVKLKENCSISSPVFILKGVDLDYNYLSFNNRYYFISDLIPIANDLLEIHASVDVLGTYRSVILSTNTFVERSSSEYDVMINDEAISQKQELVKREIKETTITADDFSSTGTYFVRLVSAVGSTTISFTGIDTYVTSLSGLINILSWVYDMQNFSFLTDLSTQWSQAIFNPAQYIVAIYWLPIKLDSVITTGAFKPVHYGIWDLGFDMPVLTKTGVTFDQQILIPENVYSDFRKYNSQYTRLSIYIPCMGQINIDPIYLSKSNVLNATFYVDFITGNVNCTITSGSSSENNNDIIAFLSGNWSVPIQIGYSEPFIKDFVSHEIGAITSIATKNVIGTIENIANAAIDVVSPKVNTIGNVGNLYSFMSDLKNIKCTLEVFESAEIPTSEIGRPLYKKKVLSTLSGYTKCSNASINIEGFDSEKEAVNSHLNTGFYIE